MPLIIHPEAMPIMASPRAKLALFTLLAFGLAGCGSTNKPADDAAAPPVAASLAVTLVKAEARNVERKIQTSGAVAAWEEMQLGVELSGVRGRVQAGLGPCAPAGRHPRSAR